MPCRATGNPETTRGVARLLLRLGTTEASLAQRALARAAPPLFGKRRHREPAPSAARMSAKDARTANCGPGDRASNATGGPKRSGLTRLNNGLHSMANSVEGVPRRRLELKAPDARRPAPQRSDKFMANANASLGTCR